MSVEVGVRDGFVAVRAKAARADAAAEQLAVLAAARPEVALLTRRALIHRGGGANDALRSGCRGRVASPPAGLLAGVGAGATPAGGVKPWGAPRAADHRSIVTLS